MLQDVRYALRSLRKQPAFVAVAVVTLALGIGANTAVFSVVKGVLLEPLPYPQADRLMRIFPTERDQPDPAFKVISYPNYQDIVAQARSFDGLGLYNTGRGTLTGNGAPAVLEIARVSASMLPLLGVRPLLGRVFDAADDRPGAPPVVLLSHGFWQRQFGGSRSVVGRQILIDLKPATVIGVLPAATLLPADLAAGQARDAWVPLAPYAAGLGRRISRFAMYGRLAAAVSVEGAHEELEGIGRRLAQAYPDVNPQQSMSLLRARELMVRDVRSLLLILMATVAMVLLIACANLANLMFARGTRRVHELAVRQSLGASKRDVLRGVLVECLILSLAGGGLGLLLAQYGVEVFGSVAGSRVPRAMQVRLDATVLAVTAMASVGAGMLFGILPALHAMRSSAARALAETGGRASQGVTIRRVRAALVVAEVAATFPLLVGAGLLAHSFWRLSRVPSGLDPRRAVVATLNVAPGAYERADEVAAFYRRTLDRLRALPTVLAAGATTSLPLSGGFSCDSFGVEGQAGRPDECAEFRVSTPGYVEALGVPILEGRYFSERDRADAEPVAVVNHAMALRVWPGRDAIGKRIRYGSFTGPDPWRTVIGVVGDVRHKGLREAPDPEFHVPDAQMSWPRQMTLVVRTSGDTRSLMAAVRQAVWSVDPAIPVTGLATMNDVVAGSLGSERFRSVLIGLFALVALLMALIGIYGVMAYNVGERTREIGIRLALGAHARAVHTMVVVQGLGLVTVGLIAGAPLTFGAGRMVSAFLFGITPTDPITIAGIAAVLATAGWLGSYVPARRAARVDPVVALRSE